MPTESIGVTFAKERVDWPGSSASCTLQRMFHCYKHQRNALIAGVIHIICQEQHLQVCLSVLACTQASMDSRHASWIMWPCCKGKRRLSWLQLVHKMKVDKMSHTHHCTPWAAPSNSLVVVCQLNLTSCGYPNTSQMLLFNQAMVTGSAGQRSVSNIMSNFGSLPMPCLTWENKSMIHCRWSCGWGHCNCHSHACSGHGITLLSYLDSISCSTSSQTDMLK